jgi:L-amino acid N-acyltransferase YncA
MNDFHIRPTIETDLPALHEMWYDKAVLDQQRPTPQHRQAWWEAHQRSTPPNLIRLTAVSSEVLVGFLECDVIPEVGLLFEFCVDSHLQGGHGGVGKAMLQALQTELRARHISYIWRRGVVQAVEHAFWLGVGATLHEKGYYVVIV